MYTGSSTYIMKPNKGPIYGNCTIVDSGGGRALVDVFLVECEKWKDPEDMGVAAYAIKCKCLKTH